MKKILFSCLCLYFISSSFVASAQSSSSERKKEYNKTLRIIEHESKRIVHTEIIQDGETRMKKEIGYDCNNLIVKIRYFKAYKRLGVYGHKVEIFDKSGKILFSYDEISNSKLLEIL